MARVVILPVPATGHVNPTLPLARALLTRGEEVSFCLPDGFMAEIAASGATYLPFQSTGRGFAWRPVSCAELFVSMPLHQAVLCLEALPQVLDILTDEQPDYLIYDANCLWGRLAACILRLPAVRFNTSLILHDGLGPDFQTYLDQAEQASIARTPGAAWPSDNAPVTFRRVVDHLCASYGLPPIDLKSFFTDAEPLNLVPIPPEMQPGIERFDSRFHFVGPSRAPRPEPADFPSLDLSGDPTLYVSLGSVCNRETALVKTCLAAFGDTDPATADAGVSSDRQPECAGPPWQVVLASGAINMASIGSVPDNFLVRPSVPQLDVLQKASVFVTHGGMNSVMESLWFGVPMVVVPLMAEQAMTAGRVDAMGLGLKLEQSALTAQSLREAVNQVAFDHAMHARVRQMQKTLRTMGGAQAAADAIIEFTRNEGQRTWSWPAPRNGN
jgi:UDP:flavonoid glycosyltransferase YjiC (YdhE family)